MHRKKAFHSRIAMTATAAIASMVLSLVVAPSASADTAAVEISALSTAVSTVDAWSAPGPAAPAAAWVPVDAPAAPAANASVAAPAPAADAVSVNASVAAPAAPTAEISAPSSGPAWLNEINIYRAGSGLAPVTVDPSLNGALAKHMKYLLYTPGSQQYTSPHYENPASKYYKPEGDEAAGSSDIMRASYRPSAVENIDGWLSAPYHAVPILSPQLLTVAYADLYDPAVAGRYNFAAGLNIFDGADWSLPVPSKPVLFPGPGMTTSMSNFSGNESPDPLALCNPTAEWQGMDSSNQPPPIGLPLIAMSPSTWSSKLTATVTGSKGFRASTSSGTLCVVRDTNAGTNAVFLIAKKAYKTGYYTATIKQPGRADIVWTFGAGAKAPRLGCAGFPDVAASDRFCRHISWFKDQRITKPADGLYHPKSDVNRGSMAAFLYRLTYPGKAQPKCTRKPFPDVPAAHRFCGYIQWASDNGIAFGYPDGTYRPENSVTRGAMSAYLHRIETDSAPTAKCTKKPFDDVKVDDVFCGVIAWMKTNGITYGVGDHTRYGTKLPVTRGAMAAFIYRMQ